VEKKPSTSEVQPRKSVDAGTPPTPVEKEKKDDVEREGGSKVDAIRTTTHKQLKVIASIFCAQKMLNRLYL